MTPIFQTKFKAGTGNCLTACVASLLDVSIEALPEFCIDGEWFDKLDSFCKESGYFLLYWRHSAAVPLLCLHAYVIVLLELEGTDELHAIIGKTRLESKTPVSADEIDACFAVSELTGSKIGDVKWAWCTELIHDPNPRSTAPVIGPLGYILIGKQ